MKEFYNDLYSCQTNEVTHDGLEDLVHPVLSDEQSSKLEGLVTMEELTSAVKNLKNDKSPGSDGFTAEFFKFFYRDLRKLMLRSINYGFIKGEMSVTQRQGIITCIPKEGKEKRFIKNWRPITLLNTVYKLASSCIADRIKLVLPDLIHQDQKGFMKNRNIGDNIRLLYDTLVYTKEKNKQGLLLSVDFFKAFDCLSWTFIQRALTKFNFGEDIKRWVQTFYTNISSCIRVNGQYSEWFKPKRGTRQGDPLSPYIFLICAEIMAVMMRNDSCIKGIQIDVDDEIKISQFADDTTVFLDGSENSFKACIKILQCFSDMSGLRINFDKSVAVWIGTATGSRVKFLPDLKFVWNPLVFKSLGIFFSLNISDIVHINYEGKLNQIKKILNAWTRRNLTPFGKITVIKTLALSKLTYLFMNIPDPSEKFLDELQKLLFLFLWNGKPDKIRRQSTFYMCEDGGISMVNVKNYLSALKINWLNRILGSDGKISKILTCTCPGVKVIKERGGEFVNVLTKQTSNSFWVDVFKHYKKLCNKLNPKTFYDLAAESIHYNNNICIDRKIFYRKSWVNNNLIYVKDLICHNGFLTYNEFKEKYRHISTNFLEYEGVIKAIKVYMNRLQINLDNQYMDCLSMPMVWQYLSKGGVKHIYRGLINEVASLKCLEKWSLVFSEEIKANSVFKHIKKTTTDTQLRWFQYRLIYRLIPTQRFLFLRKIVNDATCTFCGQQEETLDHLFWDCQVVQLFWTDFIEWFSRHFNHWVNLSLSKRLVILGCCPNFFSDHVFDLCLLVAKHCIFIAKTKESKPHINLFINTMKQRYVIEKYVSGSKNAMGIFYDNWAAYSHYFERTEID